MDAQLWDLVRAGNNEAFEHSYHRYAADLYRYGQRFTPDLDSIENAIQDVFIRIWENRLKITIHKSLKLYLLISFRREILQKISQLEKFNQLHVSYPEEWMVTNSVQDRIMEKETKDELSERLASAMENLSKRQKEALHLKYLDNLSYQEIAGVMNIQVPTLYNMIFRAIKLLREDLRKHDLTYCSACLLLITIFLK